jgi:hypothetical protein
MKPNKCINKKVRFSHFLFFTGFLFLGFFISISALSQGTTRTWNGKSGDGKWETAGNWEDPNGQPGVPDNTGKDDVVIPADQGVITVNDTKNVKSLDMKDNKDADANNDSKIKARDAGDPVKINSTNTVHVGDGASIQGADGLVPGQTTNRSGGDVTVTSGGDVNMGKGSSIQGGEADPAGNGNGGSANVKTPKDNNHRILGDNSDQNKPPRIDGGNGHGTGKGGDSHIETGHNNVSQSGGNAPNPHHHGSVFSIISNGYKLTPGFQIIGFDVTIILDGSGTIELDSLSMTNISADHDVFICSNGAIDLQHNLHGIDVITAGGSITMSGNVLLDPGVSIGDITQPDASIANINCSCYIVPTLSQWGLIVFGVLLLGIEIVYFMRRRSRQIPVRS